MAKLIDWGLSMYGGYYANFLIDGKIDSRHGKTLACLRLKLMDLGIEHLPRSARYDNI